MRSILILLICFVVLAKGRKTKIKLERLEIPFYDKSYGSLVGNIGKVNRTNFGFNLTLNLIRELPANTKFTFKVYKFNDNQYKETAIQMTKNLCQFLEQEYQMIYSDLIKNGYLKTFVKTCPVKKGLYYFRNAFVPESRFFNDLPQWRCRIDTLLTIKKKTIGVVSTFVDFEEFL